jgi:hypothetical protein
MVNCQENWKRTWRHLGIWDTSLFTRPDTFHGIIVSRRTLGYLPLSQYFKILLCFLLLKCPVAIAATCQTGLGTTCARCKVLWWARGTTGFAGAQNAELLASSHQITDILKESLGGQTKFCCRVRVPAWRATMGYCLVDSWVYISSWNPQNIDKTCNCPLGKPVGSYVKKHRK